MSAMNFARANLRRSLAARSTIQRSRAVFSKRTMSSSNGYVPKSDLPWVIGSAIGTVAGLVWVFRKSPSGADHHTQEHEAKHTAKHTENSAPAATPLKEGGDVEAENTVSENEYLNGTEAPEVVAGADDFELPETSKGESAVDAAKADEMVDSIKEALDSSASAAAGTSEEVKSSDSDDFVKVEKEDANPIRQDSNDTVSKKTSKKAASSEKK